MENEKKAAVFCVIAFVLGALVAFSGCNNQKHAVRVQSPIDGVNVEVQPPIVKMGKSYRTYRVD
tara:strand:+ start:224 stop:415 length:192 start_codon:yes stop_codon:yes gene_type:complete